MTKYEELNEFYNNMFTCNYEEAERATNYEFRKLRQEYLDDLLESNLNEDQQQLIDEVLYEINENFERDARMHYVQGIKDGVWLLKHLGVLE